jgi:phage repressor protein C with HTH and peptisase S24 domain
MNTSLSERAKIWLDLAGGSVTDLAKIADVQPPSVSDWLNGKTKKLKSAPAARLANYFRHNILWVSDGIGPMQSGDPNIGSLGLTPISVWEYEEELPPGEFINVPRLNVRLSAGPGKEVLEVDLQKDKPQAFRAEWIRKQRLKPSALASMYADGDSMEPRIFDGDSLLVDTSQKIVLDGKVYAVAYGKDREVRVKRLYKRVDGGVIVVSDNKGKHPTFEVSAEQMEKFEIIGRVVHVQGTGGL